MFYSSAEDVVGFKRNLSEKFLGEIIIVGVRHVRSFEIHDVRPDEFIANFLLKSAKVACFWYSVRGFWRSAGINSNFWLF